MLLCSCTLTAQEQNIAALDQARLKAVITFANNVLADGKDIYSKQYTPLLVNGINVFTKDPVTWTFPGGQVAVMSDFVCQQNLLRTLVSLSNLTGDPTYKNAARDLVNYYFMHLQDSSGLLEWGGHKFIDMKTLTVVGPHEKGFVHELKNAFPYYDFWYEVNPAATVKFIKAFWNAHVYNWETLEISRHGHYGLKIGDLWKNHFVQQQPFFETTGLSFLDAGNDLIYSGMKLYEFTGDTGALCWAKRLAHQYVLARNPKTQLGAYQYTQPRRTEEPKEDRVTLSMYGDRAQRQFGPEFGKKVLEGTILLQRHAQTIYSTNALMQLQIVKELGQEGKQFSQWTLEGLAAYARYGYIPEKNMLRPLLSDGTDLSNYVLRRDGYYGHQGTVLKQTPAGVTFLISYIRAFLETKDQRLWSMARALAEGNGLGDIGDEPGKNLHLNFATTDDQACSLFALIDLYQGTNDSDYLNLARIVGNNIVRHKFHLGYFTPSPRHIFASFDVIEPYALLALDAAIKGMQEKVPAFINGSGFAQGEYQFPDGTVRTINDDFLYTRQ
jgi:pectate lyase